MFNRKISFWAPESKKITITDFRDWLYRNWSDKWISKNSLYTANNLVYTPKATLVPRLPGMLLWTWISASSDKIAGIGYSLNNGYYYCVKWSAVYRTPSKYWTWASIWTSVEVGTTAYVDFVEFYKKGWRPAYSSTSSSTDARYVQENAAWFTENEYVWYYIEIWGETKLITSNTTDTIYIEGRFNTTPSASSSYDIYAKVDCIFMCNPGDALRAYEWSTETIYSSSYDVLRIIKENNRLFMVDATYPNRIRFSELWIWDYFWENSYIDCDFDITCIKNIKWQVIIYGETNRAKLIWDSPDNFRIENDMTHKWAISWWSVANWANIQFFLSNEGIELLNAIDNATLSDWISKSDTIRDLLLEHWALDRAQWAVYKWRYYLSITNRVYIYDIENSLRYQKDMFTTATYDECSQTTSSWAPVAWEWTCAIEINWNLVFWQWGLVYYLDENKDGGNFTATIETDRLIYTDRNRDKIVKKITSEFSECARETEIKIYVSVDWWSYVLLDTKTDVFDFDTNLNYRMQDMRIKYEITQTWSWNMKYETVLIEPYIRVLRKK